MNPFCRSLAGLALGLGTSLAAHAQVIEELSLRREGADAVLTIRLSVPVQLRRSAGTGADELLQLYYDVLPGRERPTFLNGERRTTGRPGEPLRLTVSEDGASPAQRNGRKLVIRPDRPMRMKARPGRDTRTLEVVLADQGAVWLARPAAQPTPSLGASAPGTGAALAATAPGGGAGVGVLSGAAAGQAGGAGAATLGAATGAGAGTAGPMTVPGASSPVTPDAPPGSVEAPPTPAQLEARAAELMASARAALGRNQAALAVEHLNEALNLPPNALTPEAQALIGSARLAQDDVAGARREWQLYLALYPQGAEAERVKLLLAGLPANGTRLQVASPPPSPARLLATQGGTWSQIYYGGQSRTLSQFKDTPLAGQLPQVVSQETLSGTDQKLLLSMLDLNWRQRDDERDMRFVLRDSFSHDGLPDGHSLNRLSALYLDWKNFGANALSLRVGRQSGLGGGVLGRFDGALGGWQFQPGWKFNAVLGRPVDALLETRRHFVGLSVEAERLAPRTSASFYAIRQTLDGQTDRQALGTELRWLQPQANSPGHTVFGQLEYDTAFKVTNIAAVQGTFSLAGGASLNLMLDRRAMPLVTLGNALFFAYPTQTTPARTLNDLLAQQTLAQLRQTVADTTAFATQGLLGYTQPLSAQWQWGVDVRLTNIGAIAPVPDVLPEGLPSTGNVWTLGVQAIGSNLYSQRDSQVWNLARVQGPQYRGWLASWNHMRLLAQRWQLEPSLRLYTQRSDDGVATRRITPSVRLSWRGGERWQLEGDASLERFDTTGPYQNESGHRSFFSIGYRVDF